MRILHYIHCIERGGAQQYIANLVDKLNEYDHSVLTSRKISKSQIDESIIHNLGSFDPRLISDFTVKWAPDIFFYHWFPNEQEPLGRGLLEGVPIKRYVVLHKADYLVPIETGFKYICVSKFIFRFHNHIKGCKKEIIRSGIDTKKFRVDRVKNDTLQLLKLGRSSFERFDFELFQVLHSIAGLSWRLKLVQSGTEMDRYIRRWLRRLGLEAKVSIVSDCTDALRFFANADVFVDWNAPFFLEAWGFSISESLSCGVPVISRGRGAVSEQVKHGFNGWIFDDPDDFRECLVHIINGEISLNRYRDNAMQFAKTQLDESEMLDKYRALIRE